MDSTLAGACRRRRGLSLNGRRLRRLVGLGLAVWCGLHAPTSAASTQPIKLRVGAAALDLSGQLRLRFENDTGFDVKQYLPNTSDSFLLSRLMLNAHLRLPSHHRIFLQLRDARETGSRFKNGDFSGSNPHQDWFDIRQAYYEGVRLGGTAVGVRLGRQQISYGDQRVFGPGQWGNTGRWVWDAALVNVKGRRLDADLWVGRPVRNRPDAWPNRPADKPVVSVVYVRVLGLPARFDVFAVSKRDDSGAVSGERGLGDLSSYSVGFQAEGSRQALDYSVTAVAQRGRWGADDIRAGGASAMLGVRLDRAWQPRLRAVWTWGSGDSNPSDGVHGTFDGVVGGADIAFYGYLNLFFWANLHDRELQLVLRPTPQLDLHIGAHSFALAASRDAWYSTSLSVQRRDPSGASGTSLGRELDLRAVYRVGSNLELMVGGGYFSPGLFVERTGPAKSAWWQMVQLTRSW